MAKNFLVALLFFTVLGLSAQNGTGSPYSFFGIGESRLTGTVENQMMGGIGVYTDSIHVSLRNPAAYSQIGYKSLNNGRLALYSGALTRRQFELKSDTEDQNSSVTNLDYIALGFNLGDGLGIGFGIKPFSSVGYSIVLESENDLGDDVINLFEGEGGLNSVYVSAGYEILKDFSVGATASFNFGEIRTTNTQSVAEVQFGTQDIRTSQVEGLDFNYALQYNPLLKENRRLFASARINTQINLTARNSRQIESTLISAGTTIESVDVDLNAVGLRNTELKIPTSVTLGLGYGEDKKWFVGAEFSTQNWDGFSNDFLGVDNISYQNANTFALGGLYTPDYDAFAGYFKRVTYRAGARFSNTGMIVNNNEINDFGITFGVGLPLGRILSNLNLGFEVGKRGTTDAGLIEENYIKFNLGFSFNSIWFEKRKIN